jgi:hypothetical protein
MLISLRKDFLVKAAPNYKSMPYIVITRRGEGVQNREHGNTSVELEHGAVLAGAQIISTLCKPALYKYRTNIYFD